MPTTRTQKIKTNARSFTGKIRRANIFSLSFSSRVPWPPCWQVEGGRFFFNSLLPTLSPFLVLILVCYRSLFPPSSGWGKEPFGLLFLLADFGCCCCCCYWQERVVVVVVVVVVAVVVVVVCGGGGGGSRVGCLLLFSPSLSHSLLLSYNLIISLHSIFSASHSLSGLQGREGGLYFSSSSRCPWP